jgi:hypothetical protein
MSEPKMVRIRFAEGETGWAEDLGKGEYRICNIPLCGGLNIDDVVTVRPVRDDLPNVAEVVRYGLKNKQGFRYAQVEHYRAFAARAHELGCKVEGMLGPRDGEPGMAQIAYPKDFDPEALAREVGVVGFSLMGDGDDDEDDEEDDEEDNDNHDAA